MKILALSCIFLLYTLRGVAVAEDVASIDGASLATRIHEAARVAPLIVKVKVVSMDNNILRDQGEGEEMKLKILKVLTKEERIDISEESKLSARFVPLFTQREWALSRHEEILNLSVFVERPKVGDICYFLGNLSLKQFLWDSEDMETIAVDEKKGRSLRVTGLLVSDRPEEKFQVIQFITEARPALFKDKQKDE